MIRLLVSVLVAHWNGGVEAPQKYFVFSMTMPTLMTFDGITTNSKTRELNLTVEKFLSITVTLFGVQSTILHVSSVQYAQCIAYTSSLSVSVCIYRSIVTNSHSSCLQRRVQNEKEREFEGRKKQRQTSMQTNTGF